MRIVVVGLGKMGAQIAKRFVDSGHEVIAVDPREDAVKAAAEFGAIPSEDRKDAVSKFEDEQVKVWLMISADFVDGEVDAWLEVLPEGSLLIDGGNTDFRDTREQAKRAEEKGVKFLDIGASGGVLGTENGFSMMAGGDRDSYEKITPLLDALASPRGGYEFFGEAGSGHYVKMVHNAIEYGMMESLAEGYRLLREGPYEDLDLAKAGSVWQKSSVIESELNGLVAELMAEDQTFEGTDGYVNETGETRWALEVADEREIDVPSIQASFDVRLDSQKGKTNYATKLLAELRNKFGGHAINKEEK